MLLESHTYSADFYFTSVMKHRSACVCWLYCYWFSYLRFTIPIVDERLIILQWCVQPVFEKRFLDKELSPAKYRAFFIPWTWESANTFGKYRLLKRINKSASTWALSSCCTNMVMRRAECKGMMMLDVDMLLLLHPPNSALAGLWRDSHTFLITYQSERTAILDYKVMHHLPSVLYTNMVQVLTLVDDHLSGVAILRADTWLWLVLLSMGIQQGESCESIGWRTAIAWLNLIILHTLRRSCLIYLNLRRPSFLESIASK